MYKLKLQLNIAMKFFVALGLLALVIVANAGVSMHNPFYCYMTDPIRPMTNMHATASSYEAVRRFNFTTTNPYISSEDSIIFYNYCYFVNDLLCIACTPSRFWYIGRYGGRFPHPDLMQEIIDLMESSVSSKPFSSWRFY